MIMNHQGIAHSFHLQGKNRWIGPKMTELWPFLCGYVDFVEKVPFGQISYWMANLVQNPKFWGNRPESYWSYRFTLFGGLIFGVLWLLQGENSLTLYDIRGNNIASLSYLINQKWGTPLTGQNVLEEPKGKNLNSGSVKALEQLHTTLSK